MPRLHICCSRPGLIRGGVQHPRHASYALDAFDGAALAEMLAEPELVVIIGERATAEAVGAAIHAMQVGATQAAARRPAKV